MRTQRQPVDGLIARSARPRQVAATVATACRVTDETSVRPEPMTHQAVGRRTDDPCACGGLDEVADHCVTVCR
jgi:hypothetical protein